MLIVTVCNWETAKWKPINISLLREWAENIMLSNSPDKQASAWIRIFSGIGTHNTCFRPSRVSAVFNQIRSFGRAAIGQLDKAFKAHLWWVSQKCFKSATSIHWAGKDVQWQTNTPPFSIPLIRMSFLLGMNSNPIFIAMPIAWTNTLLPFYSILSYFMQCCLPFLVLACHDMFRRQTHTNLLPCYIDLCTLSKTFKNYQKKQKPAKTKINIIQHAQGARYRCPSQE